jgi:hypothetical protein
MSKLHQISEEDLSALEECIPALMGANMETCNHTWIRMKWRRVKDILSNVRWGYGPPIEVHRYPVDDDPVNPEGLADG